VATATSTPASSTTHTTSSPAAAPSTRSFITRTDAICRAANGKLARSKATSKKPSAIAAVVRQNQAIEQKALDRLAKLQPPARLSSDWQKMVGYRRSLAQQLGVYASALDLGVKSYGGLAASKKKLHAQLREVGGRAGFRDCAKLG
jgi:hypothetical protein